MSRMLRPLVELCDRNISLIDPKREPERSFWYIDISAIDNKVKRIAGPQQVTGKLASVRARQVVQTNDILVATTRPNLNAVALVPADYDKQVCSTGFCVLRAGSELDPDYLFSFVQSEAFVQPLAELVQGALYPAVTDKQVLAQTITWVPLDEQRRIAARLKAQLAAVEEARQAAQERQSEFKKLRAAILTVAFSSLDAQENGEVLTLGEVARIEARIVDPAQSNYASLPHVSGENIRSISGNLEQVCSAADDGMESGKYLFDTGDVLYSKLRPYLRKAAIADFDGLCSADMYPIKTDPERLLREYLRALLVSDHFTAYANEASARSRMPKLNREQLFSFEFKLPAVGEQRRITTRLKAQLAALDEVEAAAQAELDEIERLPARFLAQAFEDH